MEGFVFDLQRFATVIPWPDVLTSGATGTHYFYTTTRNGDVFSIASKNGATGTSTDAYYIRVEKNSNTIIIGITKGSTLSENWCYVKI